MTLVPLSIWILIFWFKSDITHMVLLVLIGKCIRRPCRTSLHHLTPPHHSWPTCWATYMLTEKINLTFSSFNLTAHNSLNLYSSVPLTIKIVSRFFTETGSGPNKLLWWENHFNRMKIHPSIYLSIHPSSLPPSLPPLFCILLSAEQKDRHAFKCVFVCVCPCEYSKNINKTNR